MSFTIVQESGGVAVVPQGPPMLVNGTLSDATQIGTLTNVADPAFLLVGAAAGNAARKLTPTGWGLSTLLASVPAGRVPFADPGGLVTSNAGLAFNSGTGVLSAGGLTATGAVTAGGGLVELPSVVNPWPIPTNQAGLRRFGTFTEVWNNNAFAANRAGVCWLLGSQMRLGVSPDSTSGAQFGVVAEDVTLSRSGPGVWQMGTTGANALGSLLLTNLTASGEINTGSNYYSIRTLRLGAPNDAQPCIYVRNNLGSSYFANGTVACIAFRPNPQAATTPAIADLQFGNSNTSANPRMVLNHNQITGYTAILNADTTVNGSLTLSGRLGFATSDTAPANTTTPLLWMNVLVGGITYKMPLYQ